MILPRLFLMVVLWFGTCVSVRAVDAYPPLLEVYELVRTNVVGITPEQLNALAIDGMLERLHGAARFVVQEDVSGSTEPSIAKAAVLEGHFGYARLAEIQGTTPSDLGARLRGWQSSNGLTGFVLDLRFAFGRDFSAAAQIADIFFPEGQSILEWETVSARSTPKTNSVTFPVVVLVNRQTRGAPEALASTLRSAGLALILGSATAGEATIYRDYLVPGGRTLRIAVGSIQASSGAPIPTDGISPDILVSTPLEMERGYLSDPYTAILSFTNSPTATNQVVTSIHIKKRVNEAELVKSKQKGNDPTPDVSSTLALAPPRIIRDPALARAIDLLKGLNIVHPSAATVRSPR